MTNGKIDFVEDVASRIYCYVIVYQKMGEEGVGRGKNEKCCMKRGRFSGLLVLLFV